MRSMREGRGARPKRSFKATSSNVHPKYVQELLGHASIALTLDTYSHVMPGMDGGTASAMENVLS